MAKDDAVASSRAGITFASAFVFSLLWAIICNFALEALQFLDEPGKLLNYTLAPARLLVFLLNAAMLWVGLTFMVTLTGRLWAGASSLFVGVLVIGYVNHLKLEQRQEPLFPSDLQFAAQGRFLADMVGWGTLATMLVVIVGVGALVLWAGVWITAGRYPAPGRALSTRSGRWLIALRIGGVMLSSAILLQAAQFNSPGNPVRATYETSGARWAWWFQQLNYHRNGVVAGFLYNTHVRAMATPQGYSKETMERVAERYRDLAERTNGDRDPFALDDVNIVLVLSEAFSDPLQVSGATFADDPIPRTRQLMRKTDSGQMLAQLIGGGTANMEFEALTGMSLALFEPQMSSPFQMLLPEMSTFPSGASHLRRGGHDAIAIHPYMTAMYQREAVYPRLGLQRFIGEDDMRSTDRIEDGDFISDASAFSEVADRIEASDRPLFINLVTMQNHFPTDGAYDDPIPVTGLEKRRAELAAGYARGLKFSDEAFDEFLTELSNDDERTAVIFYGDHLPGFWPDGIIESNALLMRQTPFLLWSNYQKFPYRERPVTSPVHFLPMLYEDVGATIPPYYALLDAVRAHVPAMEHGVMLGPDSQKLGPSDLSSVARRVLADYRLVQYDLSVGQRYTLDEMFPQHGTNPELQASD